VPAPSGAPAGASRSPPAAAVVRMGGMARMAAVKARTAVGRMEGMTTMATVKGGTAVGRMGGMTTMAVVTD
jgi:hypothetical protein